MSTVSMTVTARAEIAAARGPGIDEGLRARFLDLLDRVPGALHRDGDAFTADGRRLHLTASAMVVDRDAEHVALLWHRKGRFWVQPGGHVDPGEVSLETAARREVAEEIGLTDLERVGPGPALLHTHALAPGFGACGEHWDVLHLLRARVSAAGAPLVASTESPRVRWVPWLRDPEGRSADGGRTDPVLPAGTVPDLPGTLRVMARVLAAEGTGIG